MTEIAGIGIGSGVAQGPVAWMAPALPTPEDVASTQTPQVESARAQQAVADVAAALAAHGAEVGGAAQEVLEAQAMMAEDPTLADEIQERITAGKTAEWSVHDAFDSFRKTMQDLGGYLGERAADLADVSQRVVAQLRGVPAPGLPEVNHPYVLVANDLAPADTALLDLGRVRGLITTEGGPTSHTAILAREKGIVAVVAASGASALQDGEDVIVDAAAGVVIRDPSNEQREQARRRSELRAVRSATPAAPGMLADGTAVPLLANLGSPEEADAALARGAEGVGLFRTEFLFLQAEHAPSISEQSEKYIRLLSAFAKRKVIVRVLDAGADKPLPFLTDTAEENPALGLRGLRALRAHEHVLRDQLTALAEAAAATDAELGVMAPMVSTANEAQYFAEIAHEHGLRTVGIMVEVPSSALLADHLLAQVDFVSIGTNDLTQYTMAADRLLGSVAGFQDPWNPAVLRLIGEVGEAGARAGKPVGICGEAAADPLLALVLVGLGATSLSMAPAAIADVREMLKSHTLDDARRLAIAARAAPDAASARTAVQDAVHP